MAENIENLVLSRTAPIFNPKMNKYGKATLDPQLVEIARTEWFPPGSSESPGSQEPLNTEDPSLFGGGGFIDSMTTNFEKNNGCVINSLIIANVNKYCKELQKHPRLKGKSCEEIILKLTKEMYKRFNKYVEEEKKVPKSGVSDQDLIELLLPEKRAMMRGFGVEPKKKRMYGLSPMKGFLPPWPWAEGELAMLPHDVFLWDQGGGFGTADPPIFPPHNPAYGASACCPPIGCDVVVAYIELGSSGERLGGGHQVAGKITKCIPLTIACQEHALQLGQNYRYSLVVSPPNPVIPATSFIHGGATFATFIPTSPAARATPSISMLPGNQMEIQFIICLC